MKFISYQGALINKQKARISHYQILKLERVQLSNDQSQEKKPVVKNNYLKKYNPKKLLKRK